MQLYENQHCEHLENGSFTFDDSLLEQHHDGMTKLQKQLHRRKKDNWTQNEEDDSHEIYFSILEDIRTSDPKGQQQQHIAKGEPLPKFYTTEP